VHRLRADLPRRAPGAAEAGADSFGRAEPETAARLRALQADGALEFETGGRRWFAPRNLSRLWDLLDRHPEACLVAGATTWGCG